MTELQILAIEQARTEANDAYKAYQKLLRSNAPEPELDRLERTKLELRAEASIQKQDTWLRAVLIDGKET